MKANPPSRPRQSVPAEIVADLMAAIRNQFYPDSHCDAGAEGGRTSAKQWFQDAQFLKVRVVLWPAAWLNKRGVTLKPERYKELVLEVFNEIKRHGSTGAVKFWPGYLAKCVQERFAHQEDEIYAEAKALRAQLEQAIAAAGAAVNRQPDPVASLADVHQVLASARRKRKAKPPMAQLNLFK